MGKKKRSTASLKANSPVVVPHLSQGEDNPDDNLQQRKQEQPQPPSAAHPIIRPIPTVVENPSPAVESAPIIQPISVQPQSQPTRPTMDVDATMAEMNPQVEQTAEDYKKEANTLYKAGKYSESIEFYSKAIAMDPKNATYFSNRSAARMMLNQHSESVKDCRQALALDPSMDKVYSRAAKGLLLLGDVRAAADVLRSGTQTLSSNLRLREELATVVKIDGLLSEVNSELAEKKFEKALSAMESVFRLADPSIKVKSLSGISKLSSDDLQHMCSKWNLLRAKCLIGLRDLGEATRIVQSISNSEPTNSEALTLRAELLYLNDSHGLPHIQQVLQKALTFDPDNRNALTLLRRIKHLESVKKEGNDAYQNGDNASAEALYSKFLDEDSNSGSPGAMGVVRVKVLSNRATVRSKLGKHALAVADCTTAIDLLEKLMFTDSSSSSFSTDPKNSVQSNLFYKLYLRRADSQMKIEKFEEAVRDYTTVNGIKPDREVQSALRKAEAALKQSKRKDYYKILGVDRSAGENEIKKAYRKLALMYHPDKQASLPEEERLQCDGKFKEVSEAYSVLSDPRKKEMFDSGMDVDGSSASGGAGTSPFGFGGGGGLDPDILRMFMQQAGGFHAGGGGGGFNSGGFYGGGGGGGGGFGRSRGSGSWGGSPFG